MAESALWTWVFGREFRFANPPEEELEEEEDESEEAFPPVRWGLGLVGGGAGGAVWADTPLSLLGVWFVDGRVSCSTSCLPEGNSRGFLPVERFRFLTISFRKSFSSTCSSFSEELDGDGWGLVFMSFRDRHESEEAANEASDGGRFTNGSGVGTTSLMDPEGEG